MGSLDRRHWIYVRAETRVGRPLTGRGDVADQQVGGESVAGREQRRGGGDSGQAGEHGISSQGLRGESISLACGRGARLAELQDLIARLERDAEQARHDDAAAQADLEAATAAAADAATALDLMLGLLYFEPGTMLEKQL